MLLRWGNVNFFSRILRFFLYHSCYTSECVLLQKLEGVLFLMC
jgi:hypothetical protein